MGIQPKLFFDCQQMLFTRGEQVFNRKPEAGMTRHAREVTKLEARLRKKDEVLAEVMAEYVALKKSSGVNLPPLSRPRNGIFKMDY
jgi:hypothetical protein